MTTKSNNNLALYKSDDGQICFNVNIFDDTVWLTKKQMSNLFDSTVQNIGQHIKSIFADKELYQNSTINYFFIVQKEGNRNIRRKIEHYNLDMIIAVGYRVQSKRATQFRQWATKIISYLEKHKEQEQEIEKFREIKYEIKDISSNKKIRNKISRFVKDLGDEKSELSKNLRGYNKIHKTIKELVKLINNFL